MINVEVVDQVRISEPEPEPEVVVEQVKSNGNKWARPNAPEVLKEALQIKSAKANPCHR